MTDFEAFKAAAQRGRELQEKIDAAGMGNPVKAELAEARAKLDKIKTFAEDFNNNRDAGDNLAYNILAVINA